MLTTFSQVKLEEKLSSTWWENPRECFNTKGQAWLPCQNNCFIYLTEIGAAIISNPTTFHLKFLSALQLTHLFFCINLFQPNHVTPTLHPRYTHWRQICHLSELKSCYDMTGWRTCEIAQFWRDNPRNQDPAINPPKLDGILSPPLLQEDQISLCQQMGWGNTGNISQARFRCHSGSLKILHITSEETPA